VSIYKHNEINLKDRLLKIGDVLEVKVKNIFPENGQVNLIINTSKEETDRLTSKSFSFNKEHFGKSVVEKRKKL